MTLRLVRLKMTFRLSLQRDILVYFIIAILSHLLEFDVILHRWVKDYKGLHYVSKQIASYHLLSLI